MIQLSKQSILSMLLCVLSGSVAAADNWVYLTQSTYSLPYTTWTTNIYVNEGTFSTIKVKGSPDQTLVAFDEFEESDIANHRGTFSHQAANCDRPGMVYTTAPEYDHFYVPPTIYSEDKVGYLLWKHACGWLKKQSIWSRFFGQ